MGRKKIERTQDELKAIAEKNAAASAKVAQAASKAHREIGPLPPVQDPARRERCKKSLKEFLLTYFPDVFSLQPFSQAHLDCINKMQQCIEHGALFALALPRGFGKSSMAERAAIYALLYGYRHFLVITAANVYAAQSMLASIRLELEANELLLADFPEVCYPIAKLEGIPIRANGQLLNGERTRIKIAADTLVLPTVPGSVSTGAVIRAFGIQGRIRGTKMTTQNADGNLIVSRPDLAILDDIATDETSNSPQGNKKILDIVSGAILGLAGQKRIAAFLTATVIAPNDAPDQLLDNEQHPEWQGMRHGILRSLPNEKAMKIWSGQYKELWRKSQNSYGNISLATDYYRQHRKQMDAGAVAQWPELYDRDTELSAVQHGMNLYIRDEQAFWAEYMNDPKPENSDAETGNLTKEHILDKLTGQKQFFIPGYVEHLILAVDVQQSFLPWLLLGVADDYTSHICAYGAWPQQSRPYYTLQSANPTLASTYPGLNLEAQIYKALDDLVKSMCGRTYKWDGDNAELSIELAVIDSAWGLSTRTVYSFCRDNQYKDLTLPAKGAAIGPNNRPFSEYRRDQSTRPGDGWLLKTVWQGGRRRYLLLDSNHWRSFLRERILSPQGTGGCLTICGQQGHQSDLIVESLTSEISHRIVGNREIDVWQQLPRKQNHLWDCCCMAMAGASYLGCALEGTGNVLKSPSQSERNRLTRQPTRTPKSIVAPTYAPPPTAQRKALSGTIAVKR